MKKSIVTPFLALVLIGNFMERSIAKPLLFDQAKVFISQINLPSFLRYGRSSSPSTAAPANYQFFRRSASIPIFEATPLKKIEIPIINKIFGKNNSNNPITLASTFQAQKYGQRTNPVDVSKPQTPPVKKSPSNNPPTLDKDVLKRFKSLQERQKSSELSKLFKQYDALKRTRSNFETGKTQNTKNFKNPLRRTKSFDNQRTGLNDDVLKRYNKLRFGDEEPDFKKYDERFQKLKEWGRQKSLGKQSKKRDD